MDGSLRPLRVPPETFTYADKHHIFQLLRVRALSHTHARTHAEL